jgi:DNA polymerase (family X)
MENKGIIQLLKLQVKLLELNDENVFKIKAIQSAIFNLEKHNNSLSKLAASELESIPSVGKSISKSILEILKTGTFEELEKLLKATPNDVVKMLSISGLGAKKVRLLWKELGIETLVDLKIACIEGRIVNLKGFGENMQEDILEFLTFEAESKGRFYYADVEQKAYEIEKLLKSYFEPNAVCLVGSVVRRLETIEKLTYIIANENRNRVWNTIDEIKELAMIKENASPFIWRGKIVHTEVNVEIKVFSSDVFTAQVYIHNSNNQHLNVKINDSETIQQHLLKNNYANDTAFYKNWGWQYISPEIREGSFEIALAKNNAIPKLLEDADLKGTFHNHSTYSDGENTLEEMAVYCKSLGYEYLGISDHSKSAFYAKGLNENQIESQHKEIESLNQKLSPFKIFKGIESDILADGSLDYEIDVLKSFDFIVASVHANLKMDIDKATTRLIKAIENPYTTMLGHPTGRLLLRRQGYPTNYNKIIDACAANGVVIEINANPWRLDLDWRYVNQALEKGVMLSINPDAHKIEGFHDMHYGVLTGRKGGLSAAFTFNALSLKEVESYLQSRSSKIVM